MEKYSAFRDPGTGIQPFLKPVPPNNPTILANVFLPFRYLLGFIRTVLVLTVAIFYVLLVQIFVKLLYPIAPLHEIVSRVLTAVLARTALAVLGFWWIPVTIISRKRGRGMSLKDRWNPKAGDVIISNWSSWIEILWLSFRFNPIFVLPITGTMTKTSSLAGGSTPNTPGRRTGTGSAEISLRQPSARIPISGFRVVSLLGMIGLTGRVPPYDDNFHEPRRLDSIQKEASRPIVIFPECTTSNGRAMLRFADVFGDSCVPVKGFSVFVMCIRYDPPTLHKPTMTCAIPSSRLNPLPHMFQIASCVSPYLSHSLSIRLLSPAESPSSQTFLASDVLAGGGHNDELTEACSALIAQLGKMKVTGQAWEDKAAFLNFYQRKIN